MRPLFLGFALAFLAACQSGVDGHRFHLQIADEVEARDHARQVQATLSRFMPIIAYDERYRSLNIALAVAAPPETVRTELEGLGIRPLPGLVQPSSAFLARVECGIRQSCEADRLARCTFTTNVTREQRDHYLRDFAERLANSGYTVLAVTFSEENTGQVALQVPFYDQCAEGAGQLAAVWREVAHGDQKSFRREGR